MLARDDPFWLSLTFGLVSHGASGLTQQWGFVLSLLQTLAQPGHRTFVVDKT